MAVFAMALVMAGGGGIPARAAAATNAPAPLLVYCGAGLRPPVAEIADLFQRQTGVKIDVNYGPSTALLTQLKLSGRGDVFLPGDDFYVQQAREQGLVEASHPVATFVPVILVARGNPLGVKTVADLARKEVRLGLADERVAAVGRITPAIFATNGVPFEPVRAKVVLNAVTAPELGQAVKLGHLDAAITWQAVGWQYAPEAEIVPIPAERNILSPVAAAVVTGSKNKDAALGFVKFLQGPAGQDIFRKHHYDIANPAGDSLTVAAAASMKFALDELVPAFEKHYPGMAVKVVTGASGSLVAQISEGAPFDVFLSADTRYPQSLVKANKASADSIFVYAVGSLAVWTRKDSNIDVEKLGMQSLTQAGVKKIAIANPAHAPYGEAAVAAMKHFDVYDTVRDKLVLGENIAQALQFVESGNADLGLIAFSMVTAPRIKDRGKCWVVPSSAFPKLEQAGIVVPGANNAAAAREFKKFILGADGRAILKKNGFGLPDEE